MWSAAEYVATVVWTRAAFDEFHIRRCDAPGEAAVGRANVAVTTPSSSPQTAYDNYMDVATVAPAAWSHAVRVFGSAQKASRWMETRLSELNDRTPEEVLAQDPTAEDVEAILDRIEYGVFG
jgi:hypothetical protein